MKVSWFISVWYGWEKNILLNYRHTTKVLLLVKTSQGYKATYTTPMHSVPQPTRFLYAVSPKGLETFYVCYHTFSIHIDFYYYVCSILVHILVCLYVMYVVFAERAVCRHRIILDFTVSTFSDGFSIFSICLFRFFAPFSFKNNKYWRNLFYFYF